jgi:hypothetical protein
MVAACSWRAWLSSGSCCVVVMNDPSGISVHGRRGGVALPD